MRSRFSAFVRKDAHYLYRTLHPEHDEHAQGGDAFVRKMKQHFAERIVYQKLEVLDSAGPDATGVAKVLFRARVMRRGKDVSFAELSYFAHDGVGLRYLSGSTVAYDALGLEHTITAFERGR
jgi:SEC-C motif-containing protein